MNEFEFKHRAICSCVESCIAARADREHYQDIHGGLRNFMLARTEMDDGELARAIYEAMISEFYLDEYAQRIDRQRETSETNYRGDQLSEIVRQNIIDVASSMATYSRYIGETLTDHPELAAELEYKYLHLRRTTSLAFDDDEMRYDHCIGLIDRLNHIYNEHGQEAAGIVAHCFKAIFDWMYDNNELFHNWMDENSPKLPFGEVVGM